MAWRTATADFSSSDIFSMELMTFECAALAAFDADIKMPLMALSSCIFCCFGEAFPDEPLPLPLRLLLPLFPFDFDEDEDDEPPLLFPLLPALFLPLFALLLPPPFSTCIMLFVPLPLQKRAPPGLLETEAAEWGEREEEDCGFCGERGGRERMSIACSE